MQLNLYLGDEFIDTIAIEKEKAEDYEYLETMKGVMREKNKAAIDASEKEQHYYLTVMSDGVQNKLRI